MSERLWLRQETDAVVFTRLARLPSRVPRGRAAERERRQDGLPEAGHLPVWVRAMTDPSESFEKALQGLCHAAEDGETWMYWAKDVRAAHAREVAAARREALLEAARLIREGAEVPQGAPVDTGTMWRSTTSRSIATWLEERARAGGGTKDRA